MVAAIQSLRRTICLHKFTTSANSRKFNNSIINKQFLAKKFEKQSKNKKNVTQHPTLQP